MIVYGHGKRKYELTTALKVDCDGTVYTVNGNPGVCAKIYEKSYRTDDMEQRVINAANGTSSMLREFPIDVLYQHGRFAGYTFEDFSTPAPIDYDEPSEPVRRTHHGIAVVVPVAAAVIMSLLIYCFVFPALSIGMDTYVRLFCARGLTMIIGGWAAMLLFMAKGASQIDSEGLAAVVSAVSYAIGAALICGVIYVLVAILSLAYSIIVAVLPTLVIIGVIIYVLKKYVFRR